MDFAIPADHRVKLKECEKKAKYLDLARELKKLWNMKVELIPIAFGLVQGLEDFEIKGRVEPIQTTTLLKSGQEYGEKSPRLEICCHSNSSEKPLANTGVKNS